MNLTAFIFTVQQLEPLKILVLSHKIFVKPKQNRFSYIDCLSFV